MPTGAIITADIVNSTLLPAAQEKKLAKQLSDVLQPYKYEFYRGDSFQAYIKEPARALAIVLRLRTTARRISFLHDIRASVGIGQVPPRLRKLNTASDEAFVLSGRAFDILSKTDSRLMIQSADLTANHGFRVISYFVDYLLKGITEKQAEVLFQLVNDNTQLEAAKNLRKSTSTVNKHAQAAGWHELVKVLTEFEELVSII